MPNEILKIGELAKRTGSQVETIRYYEQEGLLSEPTRSDANYRLYGSAHVERLQFILHCRSLDMTLDEIRNLLAFRDAPEENCEEVNVLLDEHIEHVTERIRNLQALKIQLKDLRSLCHSTQSAKDCKILQKLSDGEVRKPRNLGTHKGGSC